MRSVESNLRCAVVIAIVVAITLMLASAAAYGSTYSFVNIADTSGPFGSFPGDPAINASGTVAFYAQLDNGKRGIFTAASANPGAGTTALAESGGVYFDFGKRPTINNAGVVALSATVDLGSEICTGAAGTAGGITTVIPNDGSYPGSSVPSINNSGAIAFHADNTGVMKGIYVVSGGVVSTIVETGPVYGNPNGSAINDTGEVAFFSAIDSDPASSAGIFKSSGGGMVTTIATAGGPYALISDYDPSINNAGTVAFWGMSDAGVAGIFTGTGGTCATIVDSSGPFSNVGDPPAINNVGTIAFRGSMDAGGEGLFIGPDPLSDRVIRAGDPLFGSTLSSVRFYKGLNDNNDLAFTYWLSNGVSGVAVAVAPEPAGMTLLAGVMAGAMFLLSRRRSNVE